MQNRRRWQQADATLSDISNMRAQEPLVATYSLAVVDPQEELMGVAVQSHYFAVGPTVVWTRPGVGVVATQSVVDPNYGPRVLDSLEAGETPARGLDHALVADRSAALRQVAVADSSGDFAVHTGERCILHAGHVVAPGISAQANMMARPGVPEAMVEAWSCSEGSTARRMLAALQAAERAGGDVRGRQSAALVLVATRASGEVVRDRPLDLRVDDHADPLSELDRLLTLSEAYRLVDAGDEFAAQGDLVAAEQAYAAARSAAPDREELRFWQAMSHASLGGDAAIQEARELLSSFDTLGRGRWWHLATRLPASGLFRLSSEQWDRLLAPQPGMIYHILGGASSLPTEGFVHCSFAHQLESVAARHFRDFPDPEVLEIDVSAVAELLRVEDSYGLGEAFPHLYGEIPPHAVRRQSRLSNLY